MKREFIWVPQLRTTMFQAVLGAGYEPKSQNFLFYHQYSNKSCRYHVLPDMQWGECHLRYFKRSITSVSSWESTIQIQIEFFFNFYKIPNQCTSKMSKSWKNKERLRNLSQIAGDWQLNAIWDSGLDPGTEQDSGKTDKIWIKSVF